MDQQEIIALFRQYAAGTITPEGHDALMAWLEQADAETFHAVLDESGADEKDLPPMPASFGVRLETRLDKLEAVRVKRFRWGRWAAAAAVFCGLVSATIWYVQRQPVIPPEDGLVRQDAAPGTNKAVLTLGDGSEITLDEAAKGRLGLQGSTEVIKQDSGLLAYQSTASTDKIVQYNTLTTPRGGQYRLVLPDGTRVWLNAASSLYYPTAFTGSEREVVLKGEAYFEVAKHQTQPFRLKVDDVSVVVLGTHFNVMAYQNEKVIQTTLVEGAVRLEKGHASSIIRPGQEGSISREGDRFTVKPANVELATAWTRGLFHFENADIASITRQIARWYDVDIEFQGKMPDRRFMGVMSRNTSLSIVLKILEGTDVHFRQEGKKLIVMPGKG